MKLHILAIAICVTFGTLGTPHSGRCAAKTPQLVAAMQEQYVQMNSFKAEFSQKSLNLESGAEEVRSGILLFQRPSRIRWETLKPEPELLLVTEKEIWNSLPAEKTATRYSPELAADSRSVLQVITGQSRLDKEFSIKEVGKEGDTVILLLYPHEPTVQFTEGRLWINSRTKLIQKAEITGFYTRTEISLHNLAMNLVFRPEEFAFTPPPGFTVEDRLNGEPSGSPLF